MVFTRVDQLPRQRFVLRVGVLFRIELGFLEVGEGLSGFCRYLGDGPGPDDPARPWKSAAAFVQQGGFVRRGYVAVVVGPRPPTDGLLVVEGLGAVAGEGVVGSLGGVF